MTGAQHSNVALFLSKKHNKCNFYCELLVELNDYSYLCHII